jgi:hypothetical protein
MKKIILTILILIGILVFVPQTRAYFLQFDDIAGFFDDFTPAAGGGGPFSPSDISGLKLWLDASDATSLYTDSGCSAAVASDGDTIGCWFDKSGTGNNFTQGTAASEPTYKTAIQNSNSVVRFDGSDSLTKTMASVGAHTIFVIGRNNTTSAGYKGVITTALNGLYYLVSGGSGDFTLNDYNGGDHQSSIGTVNTFFTYTGAYDGAGTADRYKNEVIFEAGATGDTSRTYSNIGDTGGAVLTGDIAEILIYDTKLNSTQMGNVNAYLKAKWAHY